MNEATAFMDHNLTGASHKYIHRENFTLANIVTVTFSLSILFNSMLSIVFVN